MKKYFISYHLLDLALAGGHTFCNKIIYHEKIETEEDIKELEETLKKEIKDAGSYVLAITLLSFSEIN